MKYENTPYKLIKIWTQSGKNKYEIVRQEGVDNRIKDSITSSDYLVFKETIDLSTEWEKMVVPSLDSDTDAWYTDYRIQWDIELNQLPIKRIPFIKYNVVYKILGEEAFLADNLVLAYPRVPVIFRLEDMLDSGGGVIEDMKKVTMIVGYVIRPYPFATLETLNKTYDIQAKLHISIYNPELAI
ncbi:hypothetical protein LCGC14_2146490 [marine sediment metagenome]|uniref:Uncharacterized protein n=1 Tax=marine sediment metagenome TaxID=412755 RepID=A0A0F9DX39_9ZZZZ